MGGMRSAELLGVGDPPRSSWPTPRDRARVAVKLLHPHLCADPDTRAAFPRRARPCRPTARPAHRARARARGPARGRGVVMPWIALDLARGPTLREHVEAHGPLPLADAIALARGVLAVSPLRTSSLVHRDISPQNIVLDDRTPSPKAGSTRMPSGSSTSASPTSRGARRRRRHPSRARGGQRNRQRHYMSPEQAQGLPRPGRERPLPGGAVLYFAATGAAPFPRPTTPQVLEAQVSAPPPVPSARLVPSARPLDRIVTRAMTKTPRAASATPRSSTRRWRRSARRRGGEAETDAVAADDAGDAATAATRAAARAARGALDYLSPVPAPVPGVAARTRGGDIAAAATAVAVVVGIGIWAGMSAAGSATSLRRTEHIPIGVGRPRPRDAHTERVRDPPDSPRPRPPPPATVAVPALFACCRTRNARSPPRASRSARSRVCRLPMPREPSLGQNPVSGRPSPPAPPSTSPSRALQHRPAGRGARCRDGGGPCSNRPASRCRAGRPMTGPPSSAHSPRRRRHPDRRERHDPHRGPPLARAVAVRLAEPHTEEDLTDLDLVAGGPSSRSCSCAPPTPNTKGVPASAPPSSVSRPSRRHSTAFRPCRVGGPTRGSSWPQRTDDGSARARLPE